MLPRQMRTGAMPISVNCLLVLGFVSLTGGCRREHRAKEDNKEEKLEQAHSAPLLADPAPTTRTAYESSFESFGACPRESARDTVANLMPGLQECLSERLPTTVSLRIVKDGSIYSAFVEPPGTPLSPEDRSCIDAQTARTLFPSPVCGGSVIRVRVERPPSKSSSAKAM